MLLFHQCSCGVSWWKCGGRLRAGWCVQGEQHSQPVGQGRTASGSAKPASQAGGQQDVLWELYIQQRWVASGFWGVAVTSQPLCLHGHVEVMKWPLGAVWGIRLGAAKFPPKVFPQHLLAPGEFSGKAQAGTDNLWMAAVTTVQLEGLFQPCMQGRGTAASPKRAVSALIAGAHREGEGTEAGIAEVSTLLCLEEQRWIDTGRVSDIRECWLERSVSRADRYKGCFSWIFMQGHGPPALESSPCVLMSF